MTDPKAGFRMEYAGNTYKVMFNYNQIGEIIPSETVKGKWVFTADWNGQSWDADSLAQCKKIAKSALKNWFKNYKSKTR